MRSTLNDNLVVTFCEHLLIPVIKNFIFKDLDCLCKTIIKLVINKYVGLFDGSKKDYNFIFFIL